MSLFQRIISNVLEVMVTKSPATAVYSIIRKTWYKLWEHVQIYTTHPSLNAVIL